MGFIKTLELRRTMDHQDPVNVVAFSPARRASWSVLQHERSEPRVKAEVASLLHWNAKLELPWSVFYRVVAYVVETEPREALYASGSGPSIQLWRGQDRVSTLRGHVSIVRALSFAPGSGDLLASASYDNTIKLWRVTGETKTWRCAATLRGHAREVLSVSIQPARRTRRRPPAPYLSEDETHYGSAERRLLASGSWDGTVRVWSIERAINREAALVECLRGGAAIRSVVFSPDGAMLATGCDDAHVRIHMIPMEYVDMDVLKPDDDEHTDVLRGHSHWVYCVAFSSSRSDLLASCSQDFSVRLWLKVQEDEYLGAIWTPGPVLTYHQGWVYSVAFSADDRYLASGAADETINVFRIDSVQESDEPAGARLVMRHVATFDDHDGIVYSVAFTPVRRPDEASNGILLASGSVDGTLALWRLPCSSKNQLFPRSSSSITSATQTTIPACPY